jgi:hypothetical protein
MSWQFQAPRRLLIALIAASASLTAIVETAPKLRF